MKISTFKSIHLLHCVFILVSGDLKLTNNAPNKDKLPEPVATNVTLESPENDNRMTSVAASEKLQIQPVNIPKWIHGGRKTKVLEKPSDSQLYFYEQSTLGKVDNGKIMDDFSTSTSASSLSSSTTDSPSSPLIGTIDNRVGERRATNQGNFITHKSSNEFINDAHFVGESVPVVRVSGVQRQQNIGNTGGLPRRRLKSREPIRRQDLDLLSLVTEAPPLELTSLSPIESSLGGLTGLQGLPPLSFIQFIKLLVAVTPFMIPIVFIPLLIFTIGIFMIPVSKSNIFLDVDGLRSFGYSGGQPLSSIVNLAENFTSSVMMPRAYSFARQLLDHDQCVERISCELSARYLHRKWEAGNWRSMANRSWISRIMNYMWSAQTNPTMKRIAKSLYFDADPNHTISLGDMGNSEEKIEPRNRDNACNRYACQPKSFLRKFLF